MENCGKYSGVKSAGPVCMMFPCESMVARVSLRVIQLDIACETKTKDNVFVMVQSNVQYEVIKDKVHLAYYSLENTRQQMTAYINDVIRSQVPTMTLDESFANKDDISLSIKKHLDHSMNTYGYRILQALVVDVSPDRTVRDAMNQINASKRDCDAAYQQAEGNKLLVVKRAEGESEAMYLSGVGVARQRRAIMDGLKESIKVFASDSTSEIKEKEVMDLLVINQYFDTLHELGSSGARLILQSGTRSPMRDSIIEGHMALGH